MNSPSGERDPDDVLTTMPPPDDVGAATADRYLWQAMMATADVLSLYLAQLDSLGALTPDGTLKLICEHHEDWAIHNGASAEIVSAKHREASTSPFRTVRQLLDAGGVRHLFDRWIALEQRVNCRLVTTAGIAEGAARLVSAAERLRSEPDSDAVEVIEALGTLASLLGNSSASDEGAIRHFLGNLRVQHSEPRRQHIADLAAQRYGRPVATCLGQPEAGPAVWRAALGLVLPRMRAAAPVNGGQLPVVLGHFHHDDLDSRTLILEDLDTVIRTALCHQTAYGPLPRLVKANRLAVKMAHGGCTDNAVERADRLRLQYLKYWSARNGVPAVFNDQQVLQNALSRVIDEATDDVRNDSDQWGRALWRDLEARLRVLEGQHEAQGLTSDLLLGGVSDLANTCHAWFSDRFDADAALRELKRIAAS